MINPKIIKLDFEDLDVDGGTDFISLVEKPAIETDFFAFNRELFKSYTDYPDTIKDTAKRGIRLNEKVNNKCATRVGKIRATQLANGKPITEATIKRMYAYLSRAKEYYNPDDTEACGTISYLLWGGEPALIWSERKIAQIEKERMENALGLYDDLSDVLEDENGVAILTELEEMIILDGYNTPSGNFEFSSKLEDYFEVLKVISEFMKGLPLYTTAQEAKETAKQVGCEGYHTHEIAGITFYMPCKYHLKDVNDMLEGVEKMVIAFLESNEDIYRKWSKLAYKQEEGATIKFSDETKKTNYTTKFSIIDEEQKMLVSPIMVPNLPIARMDRFGELYYAYFTTNTIKRMAHKFIKNKYVGNINLEHDASMKLNNIHVVESWLKETEGDKSTKYGYKDLPEGTWFVQMKVEDDNLWKMIKEGVVKGVSLEGNFQQVEIEQK